MEQNVLTQEVISEAIEKCRRLMPPERADILGGRKRLFGMNIIEAPVRRVPKIQLSENYGGTEEFKQRFNTWLIDMFGYREECSVPPGMAYVFGNSVLMRPESVVKIQNFIA